MHPELMPPKHFRLPTYQWMEDLTSKLEWTEHFASQRSCLFSNDHVTKSCWISNFCLVASIHGANTAIFSVRVKVEHILLRFDGKMASCRSQQGNVQTIFQGKKGEKTKQPLKIANLQLQRFFFPETALKFRAMAAGRPSCHRRRRSNLMMSQIRI